VTVFGKESARIHDLSGFAERSKLGYGHFITREKIDKTNSVNLCNLLREVPGLGVTTDSDIECDVSLRGVKSLDSCDMTIYVNGHKLVSTMRDFPRSMSPREIGGIEVYSSATEPPQFPGGCGSLVVWSR
jgi:outer membrane receptor for ferrienterochelin and colicin